MNAPDSLKQKINELLDNHWEEILKGDEFSEVIYDNEYYFPIKVSIIKDGKYSTIRILLKSSMYE